MGPAKKTGGVMAIGPAWTRGEIEAPEVWSGCAVFVGPLICSLAWFPFQGTKDMGGWTAAVYTEEQQARLGVDELGAKKARHVVGGAGGLPPHWVLAGLEAPAGSKNMGTYDAAVYTAEQMERLSIDEFGGYAAQMPAGHAHLSSFFFF